MKGFLVIYDFVLTNGDDRGSIRLVRTYQTGKPLSKTLLENINSVLTKAFHDAGRATGENANAYVEFSKSWVKKSRKGDERLDMLLSSDFMIDEVGVLTTTDARAIAKLLLENLSFTEDWEVIFEGKPMTSPTRILASLTSLIPLLTIAHSAFQLELKYTHGNGMTTSLFTRATPSRNKSMKE